MYFAFRLPLRNQLLWYQCAKNFHRHSRRNHYSFNGGSIIIVIVFISTSVKITTGFSVTPDWTSRPLGLEKRSSKHSRAFNCWSSNFTTGDPSCATNLRSAMANLPMRPISCSSAKQILPVMLGHNEVFTDFSSSIPDTSVAISKSLPGLLATTILPSHVWDKFTTTAKHLSLARERFKLISSAYSKPRILSIVFMEPKVEPLVWDIETTGKSSK